MYTAEPPLSPLHLLAPRREVVCPIGRTARPRIAHQRHFIFLFRATAPQNGNFIVGRSAHDSTGKSRARRYHVRSECMTRGPFFSAQQKFRICIPPSRNHVRKLQEFFLPLFSIQIRAIRWHGTAQSVGISTPICICQAIARGREREATATTQSSRTNVVDAFTFDIGLLLPPPLSSLLSPRTSQQWDSGRGSK